MKKIILLISVLVIAAGIAFCVYRGNQPPDARQVEEKLAEALQADGEFEFSCILNTAGEEREYFWLQGQRSGDSRCINGRVLGSPLQLYYIDQTIYRFDDADQCWKKYAAEDLTAAASLYAELEPAGTFDYDELQELTYIGRSTANGKTAYVWQAIPVVQGWIAAYFTDVRYTVYTDRDGSLQLAVLEGTMIDAPDTTITAALLFAPGEGIEIVAPVV